MTLTGDYDVVTELGVGALNAILGAVHENQDPGYPPMPHSLRLLVDDRPRGEGDPVPASQRTGVVSRVELQVSTPTLSLPVDSIVVRPDLEVVGTVERSAPAGAGTRPRPDPATWAGIVLPPFRFDRPRVTGTVDVRAWVRDPTSGRLPEFLHGKLHVTTGVVRADVPGVGTFFTMDRSDGPTVAFEPAPGTAVTDEQRSTVARIAANVIRGETDPSTFRLALPPEVRHFDFHLQPEARRPSVALLFVLSDRVPGTGARASLGPGFLPDGADFAVAVGRDYVVGVLRSQVFSGLRGEFSFSKWGVSARVRPDWPGATVDLEPGRIVFTVRGSGSISWWGVDDSFTFTVRLAFGLHVVGGRLVPVAAGDPEVDLHDVAVGGGYLEGKARDAVRTERDRALAAAGHRLGEALDLAGQLSTMLAGISPRPAGVVLSGVEIRPDGVLVPGTVGLAASAPIVVHRTPRGGFDDALDSWIPGGTIDRLVWSRLPGGVSSGGTEEHRFVREDPSITAFGVVCLTVEGTRVAAGGQRVPVSRRVCFSLVDVLALPDLVPAGAPRPLLPLTQVDERGHATVTGHYDPWAPGDVPKGGPGCLLVHAGPAGGEELDRLREVLAGAAAAGIPVLGVAVAPGDRFGRSAAVGRPDGRLLVTDDADGAWRGAFGIGEAPGTVLVGPGGEVVWRAEGEVDPGQVREALDRCGGREGGFAVRPVGLAVHVGERPPDVPLRLADGTDLSLRRLRGRSLVVTFWTRRSEPSLAHLDVLRAVVTAPEGRTAPPLVVAVGDGETEASAAEVAKARDLPFCVLADPDRRLARAFGVWCWPATVWVRPDLRVEAVDLGATAVAARRGGGYGA